MYKKLTKRGWTVTVGQIDGEFTADFGLAQVTLCF